MLELRRKRFATRKRGSRSPISKLMPRPLAGEVLVFFYFHPLLKTKACRNVGRYRLFFSKYSWLFSYGLALTANIDKPPASTGGQAFGAETELDRSLGAG